MANSPATEEDPNTASDAVSLHTIAEQADAYAAQVQEDADFALALSIEQEETERLLSSQRQPQRQSGNQAGGSSAEQTEPLPPYRDDPEVEGDAEDHPAILTPYRDDPDAAPADEEEALQTENTGAAARRGRKCMRILLKLGKTWARCAGILIALAGIIFIAVIIFIVVKGKRDPKRAAWDKSGSADYDLRLTKLYPTLEDGATSQCKEKWSRYASVLRCHRMILSPAWDNGDAAEVDAAKADPYGYLEKVCTQECINSISRLDIPIPRACTGRTNRFDLTSYGNNGEAYFEKSRLEEGPVEVHRVLKQRWERLCARPRYSSQASEWGTCAAELWMRWGVVDGRNEAHLNGLDKFLEKTSVKKTIEGERRTGSADINGEKVPYDVKVPTRRVGPGPGDTDCGYCTVDWLERKMRSFEYGEILNPKTGVEVGLGEFAATMKNTLERCELRDGGAAIRRVETAWTQMGWWCENKPCHEDRNSTKEVELLLHGFSYDKYPLPQIREAIEKAGELKGSFQALHDGLLNLPCSPLFRPEQALKDVAPYEHLVDVLCSDRCRNAIDRLEGRHGKEFGADNPMFKTWESARQLQKKMCVNDRESIFCAPGYAAIGRPGWIFDNRRPSRPEILVAFSAAIDKLEKDVRLQNGIMKGASKAVVNRVASESLCNTCVGQIFIGKNPDWKKTVDEFIDDKSIDGREYVRVAKKGWRVCADVFGLRMDSSGWSRMWKMTGLDRYDR